MKSRLTALLVLSLLIPFNAHAACVMGKGSSSRFVLHGDEATDRKHGLTWKRCAIGMRWDAKAKLCSGETRGFGLNAALDYARKEGNGWRIPTGEELATLIVETCKGPKIDAVAFPNIAASESGEDAIFWTSTEAMPGMFYFFDFTNGFVDMHSRGFQLSVLLVKDRAR